MPKTLTTAKNKSLLKEFDKLLKQRSDDILLNEVIMDRVSKILNEAANGSLLAEDNEELPPKEAKEYLHRFQPHDNIRRQAERGVFVLQKQNSQRSDTKRGN